MQGKLNLRMYGKLMLDYVKKILQVIELKVKEHFTIVLCLFSESKGMVDKFKEAHVKVFNTGKLEIPGIQTTAFLYKVLDKLIDVIKDHCDTSLSYNKSDIQTVLINSNFSCNYFIDRDKLAEILKYNYHIHVVYDPCSYPGIQCKFYYNEDNKKNNGICSCAQKNAAKRVVVKGKMSVLKYLS